MDAYEVFLQVERICDIALSDLTCIVSTCTTPSSFTVPPITMSPFFLHHGHSILCEHVLEPTLILQLYLMETRQPKYPTHQVTNSTLIPNISNAPAIEAQKGRKGGQNRKETREGETRNKVKHKCIEPHFR